MTTYSRDEKSHNRTHVHISYVIRADLQAVTTLATESLYTSKIKRHTSPHTHTLFHPLLLFAALHGYTTEEQTKKPKLQIELPSYPRGGRGGERKLRVC